MTILKLQATVERDTALPEDRSTNTWHFRTVADIASSVVLDEVVDAVGDFYEAIAPTIFGSVHANLVSFKVYDLAEAKPRVPIREATRVIAPSVSNPHPEEVAICLSFRGAAQSGIPMARRRGRVFLGPVSFGTAEILNGRLLITAAARTTIKNAASAMLTVSNAAAGWKWCVFSPTIAAAGGGSLTGTAADVAAGWIDNAYDTIRSRGPASTARTLIP